MSELAREPAFPRNVDATGGLFQERALRAFAGLACLPDSPAFGSALTLTLSQRERGPFGAG